MGHTATPWITDTEHYPDDQVFTVGGAIIADCKWTPHDHTIRRENAAFIVRAVNCHADLLAALEGLVAITAPLLGDEPGTASRNALLAQAHTAISKAKGAL